MNIFSSAFFLFLLSLSSAQVGLLETEFSANSYIEGNLTSFDLTVTFTSIGTGIECDGPYYLILCILFYEDEDIIVVPSNDQGTMACSVYIDEEAVDNTACIYYALDNMIHPNKVFMGSFIDGQTIRISLEGLKIPSITITASTIGFLGYNTQNVEYEWYKFQDFHFYNHPNIYLKNYQIEIDLLFKQNMAYTDSVVVTLSDIAVDTTLLPEKDACSNFVELISSYSGKNELDVDSDCELVTSVSSNSILKQNDNSIIFYQPFFELAHTHKNTSAMSFKLIQYTETASYSETIQIRTYTSSKRAIETIKTYLTTAKLSSQAHFSFFNVFVISVISFSICLFL